MCLPGLLKYAKLDFFVSLISVTLQLAAFFKSQNLGASSAHLLFVFLRLYEGFVIENDQNLHCACKHKNI